MKGYDFRDLSVLICDDNMQMRALVRNCLMAFGIKNVTDASSAEDAFQQLLDTNPDLVITDWFMGESSGLDFVRRVRQSEESPNPYVPIIMLTAYAEMERVQTARDAGVSSFLAKPMSAHSLYKRLASLVEDQRPFVRCMDFFGPDRRFKTDPDFGGEDRRAA